ncbi:uncharacterized protein LOC128249878 isoform X2 [Octopus bimaculoides]|uniref:uncharacterized protein LOC128249878 isoform X2 n=1 Tax=Octopus bimaculoides TaxID=37653 RepID=UPI0022DF6FEA|nr:uncharacterized protein LOC128249878 isoform X2 [Octopus bimaculoides]
MFRMKCFLCWYLVIVSKSELRRAKAIRDERQRYEMLYPNLKVRDCSARTICPHIVKYNKGTGAANCRFYYEYELCAAKTNWYCVDEYLYEYVNYNCGPTAPPPLSMNGALACFTSPHSILPVLILLILV